MTKAKIWIFVEIEEHKPRNISLEILTKARELGTAQAVVLAPEADAAVACLGQFGARRVFAHRDTAYLEHPVLPAVDTLAALVSRHEPDLVLFGTTYHGRDVASRLAARLNVGVITDVVDLALKEGAVEATVSALGGSHIVTATLDGPKPGIILIRPKAFDAVPVGGTAEVEYVDLGIREASRRVRVIETVGEAETGPGLEDAQFIVSGGRGMKDPERFRMLHELAGLFGGTVGASRVAVDLGWAPYSAQVGQTGKTVKPMVYIACGISGSFQHLNGMTGSKTIIAINKDPEAPIFKVADFGVVGDVHTVLPQLIEDVARRKAER